MSTDEEAVMEMCLNKTTAALAAAAGALAMIGAGAGVALAAGGGVPQSSAQLEVLSSGPTAPGGLGQLSKFQQVADTLSVARLARTVDGWNYYVGEGRAGTQWAGMTCLVRADSRSAAETCADRAHVAAGKLFLQSAASSDAQTQSVAGVLPDGAVAGVNGSTAQTQNNVYVMTEPASSDVTVTVAGGANGGSSFTFPSVTSTQVDQGGGGLAAGGSVGTYPFDAFYRNDPMSPLNWYKADETGPHPGSIEYTFNSLWVPSDVPGDWPVRIGFWTGPGPSSTFHNVQSGTNFVMDNDSDTANVPSCKSLNSTYALPRGKCRMQGAEM